MLVTGQSSFFSKVPFWLRPAYVRVRPLSIGCVHPESMAYMISPSTIMLADFPGSSLSTVQTRSVPSMNELAGVVSSPVNGSASIADPSVGLASLMKMPLGNLSTISRSLTSSSSLLTRVTLSLTTSPVLSEGTWLGDSSM